MRFEAPLSVVDQHAAWTRHLGGYYLEFAQEHLVPVYVRWRVTIVRRDGCHGLCGQPGQVIKSVEA